MKARAVRALAAVPTGDTVTIHAPDPITIVDPMSGGPIHITNPETKEAHPLPKMVLREIALRFWANSPAAAAELGDIVKLQAWLEMVAAFKKPGKTITITNEAHALLCPVVEAWLMAATKDAPVVAMQLIPIRDAVIKAV